MGTLVCHARRQPARDLLHQTFGRLYVVEYAGRNDDSRAVWRCRCSCDGKVVPVMGRYLLNGRTRSCGCVRREVSAARAAARSTTHGETRGPTPSAELQVWASLKARCSDPENERYGGRGIKVCERWLEGFENFLADMGRRPGPRYTIERKDNDGDYEPGNCVWATYKTQARNRRNTKMTVEAVIEMRQLWAAGAISRRELGVMYGVHPGTVWGIVTGKQWKLD